MKGIKGAVSLYFRKKRFLLIIIAVAFAAGVYMGVNAASGSDLSSLDIGAIYASELTPAGIISKSFFKNIQLTAWICIAAMSVIGFPAILYIIYSKGMAIGCTVYALMSLCEGSVWKFILCFAPYIFFLVMSFLFTACEGISFSVGVFGKVFGKNRGGYDISTRIVPFAANVIFSSFCVFSAAVCENIIKSTLSIGC